MIFEHSIIRTTGQVWKVRVWGLGTLTSIALVVVAFLLLVVSRNNVWFVAVSVLGIILVISSYVFALVSIKCPSCEMRWVFQGIFKIREMNWYDWLAAQSVCPDCGYSGHCERPANGPSADDGGKPGTFDR